MKSEKSDKNQNENSQDANSPPIERPEHLWKPGQSGNPAGRPPGSGDPLKEIGKRIAQSRMKLRMPVKQRRELEKSGLIDEDTKLIDEIMIHLATSTNPAKIVMYLERTFGKVPNINLNTNQNIDIVSKFKSKFTDSELESISGGADALEILLSKLPDINNEGE